MTSFLREYHRIMDTIHANEDELDNKVENKKVLPTRFLTKYYIERQAHDLYNLPIFRKFQHTLKDVTRFHVREQEKDKVFVLFQANNCD
jgi:hypothetical protein